MNTNRKAPDSFQEAVQNEEMTYVEYINQYDEDLHEEYKQYCKDNNLDPDAEDSAISFIEYHEDELDANMEY